MRLRGSPVHTPVSGLVQHKNKMEVLVHAAAHIEGSPSPVSHCSCQGVNGGLTHIHNAQPGGVSLGPRTSNTQHRNVALLAGHQQGHLQPAAAYA